MGAGDEFLAVIPWHHQIKPPTGFKRAPKDANTAPPISVELEWVHGYKGDCAKNNLAYMADGTLAYYIAAVGVVYNPEQHTQRHFTKHTDDITCMDFHPDKVHVVTSENGKKPKTYIWNTETMTEKHCLTGHGIMNTCIACAFSVSGKNVVLIAGNDDHNVAVYDVETGTCVAESKGCRDFPNMVKW